MSRLSPRVRLNSPAPSTPGAARGASPSASPLGSPATPSKSGASDSTYQRTFQAIVKNISIINSNWRSLSNKWSDSAARVVKQQEVLSNSAPPRGTSNDLPSFTKQSKALETEQVQLFELFDKLSHQLEQMKKNSAMAQQLLLDMSKRKGLEAAFAEPLFLTWPLSRFVDHIDVMVRGRGLELLDLRDSLRTLASSDMTIIQPNPKNVDKEKDDRLHQERHMARRMLAYEEFFDICDVELTTTILGEDS